MTKRTSTTPRRNPKPARAAAPAAAAAQPAADDWRQHQLRQRARGKGKHAMPHGRYSATKKTLHNGVVARPEFVELYLGDEHWSPLPSRRQTS
jgi:hypothetical protein